MIGAFLYRLFIQRK